MTVSTDLDRTVNFTLPNQSARGRIARLGPVLCEVLEPHAYPAPVEKLLAEALTLTALLGSTLKDLDGQLTLQAQSQQGIMSLLVCDYKGGELRGYAQFDAERLAALDTPPSLSTMFEGGYLAMTFDQAATGERYQGIVPLEGDTLAEVAETYFDQSEQIPTLIRLGVGHDEQGNCISGGLFLQYLPQGEVGGRRLHTREENEAWEQVEALGSTISTAEMVDGRITLETQLWRLFNEDEVRVQTGIALTRGCRCDPEYIASVLTKFSPEDRQEMAEDGVIKVDCAFCAKKFPIPVDLTA